MKMGKVSVCLAVTIVHLILLLDTTALPRPSFVPRDYCENDVVIKGYFVEFTEDCGHNSGIQPELFRISQVFKGPRWMKNQIIVISCGSYPVGDVLVVAGKLDGEMEMEMERMSHCDRIVDWRRLSREMKAGLKGKYKSECS